MLEITWKEVDRFLLEALGGDDEVLTEAVQRSHAAGLPSIQVATLHARFLMLLARLCGARRILEIGTLGGYSTIHLARALPNDGELITLELKPEHADVARENLRRAGLEDRVTVRVGPAMESLAALRREQSTPFDLIFIDADKTSNPEYLTRVIELSRPGTLIILDNVIRRGRILETDGEDDVIVATRRLHQLLGEDPRLEATVLQTVGAKGYDGMALARVKTLEAEPHR